MTSLIRELYERLGGDRNHTLVNYAGINLGIIIVQKYSCNGGLLDGGDSVIISPQYCEITQP